jgi:hypothetical protein
MTQAIPALNNEALKMPLFFSSFVDHFLGLGAAMVRLRSPHVVKKKL